jgi:hypothetical protein
MRETSPRPGREDRRENDLGCAYLVDEPCVGGHCGAPRQAPSSYCSYHHSLCYVVSGSTAEARRLREVEKLANAVGGRRGRHNAEPSRQFLDRLEQAVRACSRALRS